MSNDNEPRALLPAGSYKARADRNSIRFGEASTGAAQIAVTFDLLDPKAEGIQERITWIASFKGGAIPITLDGLCAAGWTGTDLNRLTEGEGIGDVECSLKIGHDTNNETGKTYARVEFVNAARSAFAFKKELDATGIGDLNDRLAGEIMAARERAAGKGGANPSSGGRGAPAGGGYGGGGRAPARGAAQRPWDGTGADPNGGGGDDIPFASCSPDADPMMRGMATA